MPQVFNTFSFFTKIPINRYSKADFLILFNPPYPMSLISFKIRAMCLTLADKALHETEIHAYPQLKVVLLLPIYQDSLISS